VLRAVLDTSSLVSYVLSRGDIMEQVVGHWEARTFAIVSSPATRAELAAVLARSGIRRLAEGDVETLVSRLERFSEHVPGRLTASGACRDPKDDKFLACALEGGAQYLVTSDRDLLDMRHYQGLAIVNPGQFLVALELHGLTEAEMAGRFGHATLADIQAVIPLDPDTARRVAAALTAAAADLA
jgi:uncharacterized protein